MVSYSAIEDYIRDLKRELSGVDEAIISDAIDDTEEHLGLRVQELLEEGVAKLKEDAVAKAVADFGTPSEVARAYLELNDELKGKEEKRQKKKEKRSLFCDIFCIYGDWRVYTGLIYLLLMFPLGLIYFTYMVTMISLGIGMLVTVLGIFILILFLLSNYGLSWLHSRMTEVMLGIRMPRKPRKLKAKGTWWQRIKAMFRDPRMYSSLLYMFLMFPLGIFYFTVFVTLIAASIGLMMSPFTTLLSEIMNLPIGIPSPPEARAVLLPLAVILGFLLLTWTLHLSSILAHLHGKLTRSLLLKR
ncbi:MAG: sensor domain-containing protein [Candidatus Thermoplasmatota archaeon]|nr:sensor domain-containing protein [Candidatus Thermoplasmatota archaeon]